MPDHLTHLSPADLARIREARCAECWGDGTLILCNECDQPDLDCVEDCGGDQVETERKACNGTGRPEVVWLAPMVDRVPDLCRSPVRLGITNQWSFWHPNENGWRVTAPHRAGDVLVVAEEWWGTFSIPGHPRSYWQRHYGPWAPERAAENDPEYVSPPETMPLDIPGATRILATADPVAVDLDAAEWEPDQRLDPEAWSQFLSDHPGQRFAWLCKGRVQDD